MEVQLVLLGVSQALIGASMRSYLHVSKALQAMCMDNTLNFRSIFKIVPHGQMELKLAMRSVCFRVHCWLEEKALINL